MVPGMIETAPNSNYERRVRMILKALFLFLFSFAVATRAQSPNDTPSQTPPAAPPVSASPVSPAPKHYRVRRPRPATAEPGAVTLVGAGDIAGCENIAGAAATAKLIEQIPGTVFAAGDVVYERGTVAEFRDCYGPTWGKFKDRTRPSLGNHEYGTANAAPYFAYFGNKAGPVGKGYYSYDLGA